LSLCDILVGFLERGIDPSLDLYLYRTAQHKKTQIFAHASGGIRNQDLTFRAIQNHTLLRPRGHWGWLVG